MKGSRAESKGGRNRERGQALLMGTLTLVPTLALIGFVVDVGWAHFRKEACMSAAISGATAAARAAESASNFTCGSGVTCQSATACPSPLNTPANPIQAACLYAKQNGFTNGSNNDTVKVDANITAPPTVSGVSPSYWIRVTVTEQLPLTFLSVLGQQFVSVSAESIGAVFGVNSPDCFYIMGSSGIDVNMTGGGVTTTNCSIYVNSTSANAVSSTGGTITTPAANKTHIRGGWSHSGGSISPSPILGAAAQSDPFASMAAITTSGLTNQADVNLSSGSQTINPGIYTNTIQLSGGTLTLNPGVYYLENGLNITGGTIQNNSGGVTFYVDGGGISQTGGAINLNAPTSGTEQGILVFQSRSNGTTLNLTGGTQTMSGAVYAVGAPFNITGGTFTNTTFVVSTMSITGGTPTVNGGANTPYTSPTVGRLE